MKHNSACFKILNDMIDCICHFQEEQNKQLFNKLFNQLRNILHKEYFTPFDREDIYMIAVKLDSLFNELLISKNNNHIFPLLLKINEIIRLFDTPEKNKFKNLFNTITEYQNISKSDILLNCFGNDISQINTLIKKCNEIVIQIEYTILKNS